MKIQYSLEVLLPLLRARFCNNFVYYNDLRSYGRRVKISCTKEEEMIDYVKSLNSEIDINPHKDKWGNSWITIHFGRTKEAKQSSYIQPTQINKKVMNLNAIAITDLEQIKSICQLIPSIKEQIKTSNPEIYAELFPKPIKVGDRFENEYNQEFILAHEGSAVALVNLANGSITTPTIHVYDIHNITDDELVSIAGMFDLTLIEQA
jgi:hypothetical protein